MVNRCYQLIARSFAQFTLRAKHREEIMRQALVESYINQLRASFGRLRTPVTEEELRALYDTGDYAGMVSHIQRTLRLDVTMRLGLVNKGGPNAPAWVEAPVPMPMYGTAEFRQLIITMYLRKAFLARGSFDEVVMAIAHELCHVVLDAIAHPLQNQEEAVDLTAMLLGFRDFYVTGCRSVRRKILSPAERLAGYEVYQISSQGYLTQEEVSHAATYMTYR
jgi:hypothetical protein